MKIHKITTKNFLTLQDCIIDTLDEQLNFFVGPNGSGKTSLFRALRVLTESFDAAGSGTRKTLDHLYSVYANSQQMDINVEISWNTDREQRAICAFLYASLNTMRPLNEAIKTVQDLAWYQITPEKSEHFSDWLREQCIREKLQFMFTGQLHLTYREDMGTRLSYAFTCKNEPITILMGVYPPQDGTFWKGSVPTSPTLWYASSNVLLQYLFPQKDFLVKETITVSLIDEIGNDDENDTHEVINKNAIETRANKYFAYPPEEKPMPLDMESFVLYLAEQYGYLEIGTVNEAQTYLPEYVLLKEMSGINFSQPNSGRLSCSKLFSLLLHDACVFTKSVFTPFDEPVPFDDKKVFPIHRTVTDENDIPYWLLGIKNGTPTEKMRYERIQNSFTLLTGEGRTFDLSVKTSMQLGATPSEIRTIDILVTDETKTTISMASQGSGLWEALVLSVFLDDSEGRVILLDEPAASLHPNMQHRLVEELSKAPGQVLVVTHSPHLLPTRANRLQHVYRFQKEANGTGTRIFSGRPFLTTELQKVENKFASSINVANLLFTNGVLLVEGATEVGAFSVWIPQTEEGKGQTLADMNIALHDVGGKNNFPFYLRLLKAFGVPYAAIGDGDALIPYSIDKHGEVQKIRSSGALWRILQELCQTITMPQETDPFGVLKKEAACAGFFTYDTLDQIAFEQIPEVTTFLQGLTNPLKKADTIYEARVLAENMPVPPLAKEVLNQAIARLRPYQINR